MLTLLLRWHCARLVGLYAPRFLLCAFISSRRVATVLGYVLVLFGNLVGIFFSDVVYGVTPPFTIGSRLPSACFQRAIGSCCATVSRPPLVCSTILDLPHLLAGAGHFLDELPVCGGPVVHSKQLVHGAVY